MARRDGEEASARRLTRSELEGRERERVRRFVLEAVERRRQRDDGEAGFLVLPDHSASLRRGLRRRRRRALVAAPLAVVGVTAVAWAMSWSVTRHGTPSETWRVVAGVGASQSAFLGLVGEWVFLALVGVLGFVGFGTNLLGFDAEGSSERAMRRAERIGVLRHDRVEIWDGRGGHASRIELEGATHLLRVERRGDLAKLTFAFGSSEHTLDDVPWTPSLENALVPWGAGWSGDGRPAPARERLA